jgi:hypothetical protein
MVKSPSSTLDTSQGMRVKLMPSRKNKWYCNDAYRSNARHYR